MRHSKKFLFVLISTTSVICLIILNEVIVFDDIKEIHHFVIPKSIAKAFDFYRRRTNNSTSGLLCWVTISSELDRVATESWTKNCDGAVYFSNDKITTTRLQSQMNTIFLDLSESNGSSWSNTIATIDFINEHFSADFDWFVTAHVDTHVRIEKLREFLIEFNQTDLQYFDYAWMGLLRTGHEGGYVLSRASLSWLASKGLHNSSQCSDEYFGSERIRACLRNIGVFSGIDSRVHSAFVPRSSYQDNSSKLILTWNTLVSRDIVLLAENQSVNCPVKCELSSNKSLYAEADAITFYMHPQDAESFKQLPEVRFPWQRYVFFNTESYATAPLPKGPPLFNWSMTYQRDSDIKIDYYGQLLAHTQSTKQAKYVGETVRNKTKMIAWLVSNCISYSGREEYVDQLRRFIPVDQFGPCQGSTTLRYSCPRNPQYYGYWCDSIPFTTDYRFYLSLENAVCRNYVTEKFYQALDRLMVPIVLRKADYEDIAPQESYIAIDQFRSPKDLADYLHYLTNNLNEYIKYFEYTKSYKVVWKEDDMLADGYCRLCHMLHENRTTTLGSNMELDWRPQTECIYKFARKYVMQ